MSKKIIGLIKPFDMKQEFYVYEDNNKIAGTSCNIDNMGTTITNLCNEYQITDVTLHGPDKYLKGFVKNMKTNYDLNSINITIR